MDKKHYCPEWDYLLIDEDDIEFESCTCDLNEEDLNEKKA